MKILVIDSDTQNSESLIRTLSECGHTVRYADSGKTALEMIRQDNFDTVLLELFLKDCMGYEIIPNLKLFQSGIKIITMTQKSTPELEKKTRQCGIVFYMEKPVPLAQLEQLITQLSRYGEPEVNAKFKY